MISIRGGNNQSYQHSLVRATSRSVLTNQALNRGVGGWETIIQTVPIRADRLSAVDIVAAQEPGNVLIRGSVSRGLQRDGGGGYF